ncbi:MAG: choice-of-anchor J domain-containing protein [Bacteroidales bacterium]|nr:choice-of-anchor J domain-containing protein [Bacteroidales bacterium]
MDNYRANIRLTYTTGGGGTTGPSINLASNLNRTIECGTTYNFYDSGGPSGDYAASEDYTATFTSSGNITLTFSSFSTESVSWDYMYVYDGTSSGTTLINKAGGSTIPSAVTATSGTMTVVWHSDGSVVYPGWAATITASGCVSCAKPNNLSVSNLGASSATISWSGSASSYNLRYKTSSATSWTTLSNITSTSRALSGLSSNTTYQVEVQAVCSSSDQSAWSNTFSFTTTMTPTAIGNGWSDNFEGSNNWAFANGNQTNKWVLGTATNNGGSKSLYISNDGGSSNSYTMTSVQISYAYKLFSFTSGSYIFSYDWKTYGEGSYDYLRVWLAPATATFTAGQLPDGTTSLYDYTSTTPSGWTSLDGGSKLNLQSSWQNQTVQNVSVSAGNYYLVFMWANDGSSGSNPPAAIDNVTITPPPTNVTINVSAGTGGSVSGGGVKTYGSSVTVTANPASCYNFVSWTENGTVVSTNASYTFTAQNDRNLVANFEEVPWQPTLTSNPSATTCITQGTPVTLTAGITGVSNANSLAEYTFATGTDASKWYTLTNTTNLITSSGDSYASSLQDIGFAFPFAGTNYTQFSVNSDGNLRLGSTVTGTSYYSTPFSSSSANYNNPKINGMGFDGYFDISTYNNHVYKQVFGTAPNRVLVVEFRESPYSSSYRANVWNWQVQLSENGDIQIVYGSTAPGSYGSSNQIGLCVSASDGWTINTSTHTPAHFTAGTSTTNASANSWPGVNRYYRFTPPTVQADSYAWSAVGTAGTPSGSTYSVTPTQSANRYTVSVTYEGCTRSTNTTITVQDATPTGLTFSNVTTNRATASWNAGSATSWEYCYDGTNWHSTTSNTVTLTGLTIGTLYHFQVRTASSACPSGIAAGDFETACTARSLTWNDGGSSINLHPFETAQIPANVSTGGGTITYTSWDPTVATIDENGTLTALRPGTTTITAEVPVDDPYCGYIITRNITVNACPEITLGSGTTNNANLPSYYNNSYSLSEQLYSPCEIGKAGTISSIALYNSNSSNTTNRKFDIYLVHTDKNSFSSTSDWIHPTAADKVYSGTANTTFAANGWTTIYFDTPFEYDGIHYLALIMDNNMGSTSTSANFRTYAAEESLSQALRINGTTDYNPTSITTAGNLHQIKNQVKFGICNQNDVTTTVSIAATANPTGGGTITGTGSYDLCETVTLTATPDPCYRFVRWTENGTALPANATSTAISFKATKDRTFVAVFEEWGVSLAANGQASDITVDRGSEVTLTASTSPAPPVTPTYTWAVTAGTEGAIGTNDRTYVVNPEEVTNTYTVTAEVNGCQKSATRTVTTRCPAPTNLQVTYTANGAEITWDGDADSYNVQYSTDGGSYTETLFSDDFENGLDRWTLIDNDGDGYPWMSLSNLTDYTTSYSSVSSWAHNGTNAALSGSFINGPGALSPDNYLISPQITLGGTLTFYARSLDADWPEHFGLAVSTTNTNVSAFTTIQEWDTYEDTEYHLYTVDLSNYSGRGYIAFRNFDVTNQYIVIIDDISITREVQAEPYTSDPETVTSNAYTLTCIGSNAHTVQVQTNCGIDLSEWSEVIVNPNGGGGDVTIGDGTNTYYYYPVNMYYNYSLTQQLYTADEIGTAGPINSISFYYDYTSSFSLPAVELYMKNVSRTSFASNTDMEPVANSDMVWTGTFSASAAGWVTIDLTTPFQYDGTSNLLVCMRDPTDDYPGSSFKFRTHVTDSYSGIHWYSDSYTPSIGTTSFDGSKSYTQYRNNIKLTIGSSVPSTSPGGAIASSTNVTAIDVCASQTQPIVIESVVGVSNGHYKWYRNGVEIPASDTDSYTITSDELQSLDPGTYTYTREAYNVCTEAWEPSEGAYTIDIAPAPTYPDIVVTGYEEPIVCGNEATLSVNTHRDDLTHYWYADAECTIPIGTSSDGTGVGDAITFNVYEDTTIWHQIQEESTPTTETVTFLQQNCDNSDFNGWRISTSTEDQWEVGSGYPSSYNYSTHSGSYCFQIYGQRAEEWSYLYTPTLDLSNCSEVTLTFWYANAEWAGDIDYLAVIYSTDGGNNYTQQWITQAAHSSWTSQTLTLPGGSANFVIAFAMYDNYGYGVVLDDIQVTGVETISNYICPSTAEPITLHVSDLPTPEVQAANVTTPCGVPVTLSVGNNYDENLHYEWSFNDTEFATENIVGEGRSITISQPTNADGYNYYVRCYVIKNNNEHGCESAYATVHVTVEDAPEFTYTPETSICGDNVTLSLENTVEGYTYDWYQDNEPVNTGLNLLLENLTENTSFVINYYPTDNTQMEACYKEKEITVTLRPIIAPVVAISGYAKDAENDIYYCGTPLTFTVTNDTADMANFDYVWFSDEACTQTLNGGSSNRELNIGNLNNLEDRTVYVKACRMNTNLFEPQSAACLSNATSASITIAPIDPVVNAYYLIDPFTFETATKVDVCQDETIELIGSNDYSGTILGDAVDDQEIENKLVWYRTDGNGDSTMVGVTDNETALQVSESEPGTYYYYAFAVGHATQDEVSNSDITTTWNGVETDKGTALAFNVTSPNYTIYLNSLEVYPYDDNNATNVTVYYAQTANADPKDEDAGWAQVGTYQIMKNGNNAVPIVLNNSADEVDNSIVIPANSTYTIYLSADNDLYYNIHSDDNPRRASDPISGAGLLSGTAYGFGSNCNQNFPVPTCASEQSKMEFAGKLNLTLYGGNFCLSENSENHYAVDTVVVHEQSTTPKLEISNNQYYVCHGDDPITLTATATVTGDDISYVWMMDGETFATTTENYIEVPIPDDEEITSVEYSVVISSLTCEMTDPGSVTLNISVVPGVEDIVSDTLCAPANISQLSPSVEGEEFIEEMGWQYADSEDSEEWTTLEDVTHLTSELSGKYFRFFASTPCITGYSNAVVFVIDSVPYYDEDALKTPDPICAGAAFDWEGNNAVPNHINNSGRETRSGWNLFAGGQLTTLTADFQFEFHGIQSDYYQYNCYYVSRCGDTWDSIVSNTVTITIWDVPTIDNDIIIGNKPVCAGNPISIDAPAFTPYGEVIAHGWEYADFPGANHYTRLSDGVDIMDGDFTLGYDMNGKFVRYYVETQCGTAVSNSVQLAITAQPQLSNLTTPEAICDGTPFTLDAPEVTDNGGLDIINADWYVIIGQDDPAKVDADATITEEWNNARLFYLVENECGITSSDTITLTVNPAIGLKAYASLDGDTELEGNGCFGPDYYLVAQTNDMENVEFAWSNQMTGEVVTLERPEAGTYEYTVIATMGTGCEATATVTFTVNELMHKDTTVNVCLGELPYTFDSERQDAIFENGGDYELNYQVGAEGCDSVVTLHLNVYRPTIEHTNIHLCGGESYTWEVNGLTYGGAGIADTTLMDTVYVKGTTWISDLGNHEACDSVIQTLRVVISDGLFIDIPNDDFTVAVGEQVSAVANVRMGCQPTAAKTIMSYQLYKDGEPVDDANRYGALNFTTYLPQQNSHFSTDIAEGNGNIPGTTFNVYNYAFNYFYANFFDEIENQITATWNEPGEYEIKFVVAEMTNGQDFPMTYPTTVNGTATQIPMGGAGSTPTGLTLTDTASIVFHVDGEPVEEEETEPTANYKGHLDIDTTVFTQDINATSEFTLSIVPDAANEPTKLAVDYEIYRNDEMVATGAYGNVHFQTKVQRLNRWFGNDLTGANGSIPANTFTIVYHNYDYFYNHFAENTEHQFTAVWNQPGEYKVKFILRERTAGQDIPLPYNANGDMLIGGHGSANGAIVASDSVVFVVKGETVTLELDETICEDNLPFEYNGLTFTESTTDPVTIPDVNGLYDTLLTVNLTVITPDTVRLEETVCDSYVWNNEEFTESGVYTKNFENVHGCDSVVILTLTVIGQPEVTISTAYTTVCAGTDVPVTATLTYRAGESTSNATEVSFTSDETSRDTTAGIVTVIYESTLSELATTTQLTAQSISTANGVTCTAVDTIEITVLPTDSIVSFTATVCQGEAFDRNEEWDEVFAFGISGERTQAAIAADNRIPTEMRDTIITGQNSCGIYRAELILTVNPSFTANDPKVVEDVVCEGYDYDGNYNFNFSAEEIADMLTTATANIVIARSENESSTGCDSITELRLTVMPSARSEAYDTVCGVYYDQRQNEITESGDVDFIYPNAAASGCDSIVTVHVTVYQPVVKEVYDTVCDAFTWSDNDEEPITTSGDYTRVFTEGAANGCDSTVILHLTVKNSTHESFTEAACDSFAWNNITYYTSGTYTYEYENEAGCPSVDTLHLTINNASRVTASREIALAEIPYEWNGVTFTAPGTQEVTLTSSTNCDSVVVMTLTIEGMDNTGNEPTIAVTYNSTADTATIRVFANQADPSAKYSLNYTLTKDEEEVNDMDFDCGGRLYIGTEMGEFIYGEELNAVTGNVPQNTFHIANYHYDYFYLNFLNGRANIVTNSFTQPGTYTVTFEMVAESDGQDFPIPFDEDLTHLIGGKNSTPSTEVVATATVTFTITDDGQGGSSTSGPVLVLTQNGQDVETVNDLNTPVRMTVDANGYTTNERVAINYTILDENDEPLPMLTNIGTVNVKTSWNGQLYGQNLAEATGSIPSASFCPIINYRYNYFYLDFLTFDETYSEIAATWNVPGTYKIKLELVQMANGQDFPLTYGTNGQRMGGKIATATGVTFDTKTLTYSGSNQAANPAATGIAENNGIEGISLYPNPTRDIVNVKLSLDGNDNAELRLYDVYGKLLKTVSVSGAVTEIDLSTYASGIYLVKLVNNGEVTAVAKVMKQH